MLNHFAKVLERYPLVAIEHMMYIVMFTVGLWGLSPNNESLVIDRLVNEFGLYFTIAIYVAYIIAGAAGQVSITTCRIEHRVATTRFAFFVFSSAGIMNLLLLHAGGHFHPMTLIMNIFGLLVAGIIYLHLKIHKRSGLTGKYRVSRR